MLSEMNEGRAIITTGVGQHQMFAAQWYPIDRPRQWVTSGGLGSMGFGIPAAIGAAAANPGTPVIDIDGDGSFTMCAGAVNLRPGTVKGVNVACVLTEGRKLTVKSLTYRLCK